MKFKSRKDTFFQIFTFGFCVLFLGFIFARIYFDNAGKYEFMWSDILMIFSAGFILWLYFDTKYELTQTELKYRSGPLRGKIAIEKINKIIKGKSLWSGLKPATARHGLIIKYGKYDQIYISPKTNDTFVNKILELNGNIIITVE